MAGRMKASDPATHMNAPAATWSSSADTPKRRGASEYERIQHTIRKGQDCGERGVLQVGDQQVRDHCPARPLRAAGPWQDDRPPEHQRGEKEACVFHLVPELRAQSQFVQARDVPREHDQAHEQAPRKPDLRPYARSVRQPANLETLQQACAPRRRAARARSG